MRTRKPGSCNSTLFPLIGINSSTNGRYGNRARHSEAFNIQMTKVKLVKQLPSLENRLFKLVPDHSWKIPWNRGCQILSVTIRNNSRMAQELSLGAQ